MKSPLPVVSIGLPVFNGENFLAEAIDSILQQSFTDFELIISDNGSTDRSPEICESYASRDYRVQYHRVEKNLGASWNFNQVFKLSRGKYFKWASHDDRIKPEFLDRCLAVLQETPEASLVFTRAEIIGENGQSPEHYLYNPSAANFASEDPLVRFQDAVYGTHHFLAIFGLIPREVLQKTSLIGGYASSDVVLLGQLSLVGKLVIVNECLFQWRCHPEQSMNKVFKGSDNRAYIYWFNPDRKGKVNFPHWRLLFEYFKSIIFSDLNFVQKLKGIKIILTNRTRISGRRQYLLDILYAIRENRTH